MNIYEMIAKAYDEVNGAGSFEALPGNIQRDVTMALVKDINKALDNIH